MSDPLSLLPLACAAHGGRLGACEARELVAAGLTLLTRSAPLVRALAGKRSAILLPTGEAFLTALAASDGRGAVFINPLASPHEVAMQLEDANVGAVFTIGALADRLPPGTPHVLLDDAPRQAAVVAGDATKTVDLGTHFGLDLAGDPDAPGREEEAAIVYTSAMAGRPLGAILTHRALLHNARATIAASAMHAGDRMLALLPFSHLFGFTVTLAAPLLAGATVEPTARFHPARAAARLREGDITIVVGVPAVFAALLDALEQDGSARLPDAVRLCICGGAPLDRALQDRWADVTGVELRQGYGLTEAGPVALFNAPPGPNRRGMLGTPYPGTRVAIRDPASGAACAHDEPGEIWLSGDSLFSGYVTGGEAGLAMRDGWLRTGDLGQMDSSGRVTFVGVHKAMFTRNGFNIYPRELEAVAAAMPGVRAARARGTPHPVRGHDIALEVDGAVTQAAVAAWCADRLAAYKQPQAIVVRRTS